MTDDIRIYNKDCIKYMQEIDNDVIDLTITSPPYYNAKSYSQYNNYDEYLNFLKEVFTLVYEKTKSGRMCIVNISCVIEARKSRSTSSTRFAIPFHFVPLMENIGWKFLEDIIWLKPEGSASNRNGNFFRERQPVMYKPNVINEYIFVFQKPAKFLIDKIIKEYKAKDEGKSLILGDYERTNIWYNNTETAKNKKHSAPFPIQIPTKLVQYYSFVGDTVFDPFMGSGTTGLACINTDRKFIGTEMDKEYFEVSKERLGLKTTRLDELFL